MIDERVSTRCLTRLATAQKNYPGQRWNDALSAGQITSKLWLIKELGAIHPNLGDVLVVGSWVGVLPLLMGQSEVLTFNKIRGIDLDEACAEPSMALNRDLFIDNWRYIAHSFDALEFNGSGQEFRHRRSDGSWFKEVFKPTTIINTIWEHFGEPHEWLRTVERGSLVVIQASTDTTPSDHASPPSSIEALSYSCKLSQLLYSGEMNYSRGKRLMLIGLK